MYLKNISVCIDTYPPNCALQVFKTVGVWLLILLQSSLQQFLWPLPLVTGHSHKRCDSFAVLVTHMYSVAGHVFVCQDQLAGGGWCGRAQGE